ncbi:MAG: nucleotidyl transferase AbiEii/AbiGii toxin family protein [Chitinispirillaceae bacterium]|nr:nucleotidyl transferase AbiEii/AbiGii toxin family protein [Chitinispirillaceae bacterium]
MSEKIYYQRVQLLIQILPIVFTENCFALKGGTAINLFVRDMPRLSVDIDLVYLPDDSRERALQNSQAALDRIAIKLRKTFQGIQIQEAYRLKPDALRLIINRNGEQVKVELSPVLRGTVFNPVQMKVTATLQTQFGFVEASVVSIPDLYMVEKFVLLWIANIHGIFLM